MSNTAALFEEKKIRRVRDEQQEKRFFSIIDVIATLTESPNPQTYRRVLKKRLKDEGNESVTNCNGLKITTRTLLLSINLLWRFYGLMIFCCRGLNPRPTKIEPRCG